MTRRDPLLVAVLVGLWVAALLPIWGSRFLPLADLPDHVAGIALYHRFDDASWGYQNYYFSNRILVPYWGHYFPSHLFAYFVSIETANKLFLSIYAAALPASVLALGRRFGMSPWLAVAAFPLVFSYSFGWGFVSSAAGWPLALFALAQLDALVEAPSPRRAAGLFALTVGCYFMHLLPWLFLGAAAALLLIVKRPGRRALTLAAAALLPSVLLAAWGFHAARRSGSGMASGGGLVVGREPLSVLLKEAGTRLVMSSVEAPAWPVWLGLTLSLVLVVSLRAKRGVAWLPLGWALLALVGYLILPHQISRPIQWWNISPRMLAAAALLVPCALPGALDGWRRALVAPAIAAALWFPLRLDGVFRAFDARAHGFVEVMQHVARSDNTLVMNYEHSKEPSLVRGLPFNEFNAYAQVIAGGYNPFPLQMGFPVLEKKGAAPPAPHWSTFVGDFKQPLHGAAFDWVITFAEPRSGQLFGDFASRVPLVAQSGEWRIYRTKGIR
jgi:hypothetical protein